MTGHGRPIAATLLILLCLATSLQAAKPTPIEEDANLNDIQFVGTQSGWAVGDHGVIQHTEDGGRTWTLQKSPVDCPLQEVCFLTDKIGWIVGGGITPYTRIGYGVVLYTQDGGKSWDLLSGVHHSQKQSEKPAASLPPLFFVKFFGPDEGVAVGESSVEFPTGVLYTKDGGRSWQGAPGNQEIGWRAADFLSLREGVTSGLRGKVSLVGNGRMLPPRMDNLGLRGLWDVQLEADHTGWMVGDGGLAMRTTNAGLSWQYPPTLLPKDVLDITNFRAVEKRGRKAWLAGAPGSVIWHTPDGGTTWIKQRTGQPLPISALHFATDSLGWAVGAMGTILQTADGGQTWRHVEGQGRRSAMMAIHSRSSRVSFNLLAKLSGEEGYRSVVLLPLRRDIGSNGHGERDLDLRLNDAVTSVGGSVAMIDWQLPVEIPGLDRNPEQLIDHWNRQTEGRLGQVFLGKLVTHIRTWRPSILILDKPAPDDAATRLMNEAVLEAVKQAADATYYIHHNELAGLEPWEVSKIYEHMPNGSTGHTTINLHETLYRLKKSVQVAASPAYGKLAPLPEQTVQREVYQQVHDTVQPIGTGGGLNFFATISLQPGSAARRRLEIIDEEKLKAIEKLVRRQKHFQAMAARSVDEERNGAELLGYLRPLTRGMPSDQAAVQLMQLAHDYQQRALWDLMEATLIELVQRYPDEPVAWDGMRWLLQLWTGTETAYQRARRIHVFQRRTKFNNEKLVQRIQNASKSAGEESNSSESTAGKQDFDPIEIAIQEGMLQGGNKSDWRSGTVRNWNDQALQMASLIKKKNNALYQSPSIQFPVASLMRQRGVSRLADRFYRRFRGGGMDDPWRLTALTEIWLTSPVEEPPKNSAVCKSTSLRPKLDGVLGDDCWQHAKPLWITDTPLEKEQPQLDGQQNLTQRRRDPIPEDQQNRAFAMLAYDREYLYYALSVPRDPRASKDMPVKEGRRHDEDLLNHDHIRLLLDVDRDYSTFYSLAVDQRGKTADACWHDTSWNPTWHVAADADEKRWRVEVAIPWNELVPTTPLPGDVWAAGIVRTIPALRLESWTHPAAADPRPESFGLIRFQ